MPKDKDNNSGHAQNGEGRMLRNFILLTLPWLSLQRDILAIVKKGIEDVSYVKPVQKLTLLELHGEVHLMAISERE
jgi:hypothetical protein